MSQEGRAVEELPDTDFMLEPVVPQDIKVYSDYDVIRNNLTDSRYQFVDNMNEADILWLTYHYLNFR